MAGFLSLGCLLLAFGADPEESPCAGQKINVTVVVILASEKGDTIDPKLAAIAKEVGLKCPNLKSFQLKSMTAKVLIVDDKTLIPVVDNKTVAITIKHGADDEKKVCLAIVAPDQGEIVYRCVCGKFLPIITRYQTKGQERLILAIRVESCKGD